MCVADSYDAMSFRRPYRQGLTYDECLDELERCSGGQFDPGMIIAFRRVLGRIADGRRVATRVATQAAATIDPDTLEAFRDRDDERRPEHAGLVLGLREASASDPTACRVTGLVRRGRKTVVVADSAPDMPDKPHIGDEFVTDDELVEVFAGRSLAANVLLVDQWGLWIRGVAPVAGRAGGIAAVVTAGIPATAGITEVEGLRSTVAQTFASMLQDAALQSGRTELEAITDGLTGLYNHRYFHERLGEELERCREQGTSLALLFLDLDDFRAFNDQHGHGSGDRALRAVARVLEDSVRHVDLAARYGGEEFAAILIDTTEEGALEVAERIRSGIGRTPFASGSDSLSVSIGVATSPKDATFKDELVDKADWAMYLAKRRGRNTVMTFAAEHGADTPEQAALVGADHVAAMGELVAAREAYRQRRRSVIARIALSVGQQLDVPADELHAALAETEAGRHEPRSRAQRIAALSAAYEALVVERPYRSRISEAETLEEVLRCPALGDDDELAHALKRVLAHGI
jgi:diguanylate cyclase (GGDEF)-like protein